MNLIEKFGSAVKVYASTLEYIGLFAFLLIMVVTTIDVAGSKIFATPLKGSIDIVMLLQSVAATLACGATLIAGQHVAVEFFLHLLPMRYEFVLRLFCDLIGLALFIVIAWQLAVYGSSLQDWNEVSPTIRIPLYPYAYSAAVGCSTMCLVYLHRIVNQLAMKDHAQ